MTKTSYKGWAKINCRSGPIQLAKANQSARAHDTYLMLFYPAIDIVLLGLSEGQLNKAMLTYGLRHRVRLHEFLMVFL